MRSVCAAAAFAAAVLVVAGCGDLPRSRVHGKVSFNGKPLTGATVIFMGRDNQTYVADLKPDGTYEVTGVPRGTVQVSVQQPPPRPAPRGNPVTQAAAKEIRDEKAEKPPEPPPSPPPTTGPRLPAKYADPAQSGLTFELTGPDQEWNADLKP